MNQNRTKGRLLSLGSDYRSHRLKSVLESVEGFGASIVAIGVARAWLSLQTGIVAAFDTAPFPDHDLAWLRSAAIVVASAALSLVRLGPRFASVRRVLCCTLGLLGALLYCAGLYLVPADTVGSVAVAMALAVLFCWMLRIWCEDNCSSDLRTLLIRLCLSFVVQYLFYSVVYLVPSPVQRLVAILSPLLVMGCLAVAPQRTQTPLTSCFVFSNTSDNKNKDTGGSMPLVNVATLGIVIAACCASHGLLFGFSETVTGVWLLGSLVIAGIVLGAATALSGASLF